MQTSEQKHWEHKPVAKLNFSFLSWQFLKLSKTFSYESGFYLQTNPLPQNCFPDTTLEKPSIPQNTFLITPIILCNNLSLDLSEYKSEYRLHFSVFHVLLAMEKLLEYMPNSALTILTCQGYWQLSPPLHYLSD